MYIAWNLGRTKWESQLVATAGLPVMAEPPCANGGTLMAKMEVPLPSSIETKIGCNFTTD